jgi:hypothetical protein
MKPVGEVEGALVESGPPVGCEDDPHPMNAKAQATVRKENLKGMRRTICSGEYNVVRRLASAIVDIVSKKTRSVT